MDKLEKAANDYSDSYYSDAEYPSEIRDIINDCKSAFKAGAKWQMNNMWISINDKNKEMPNNEDMFIKMENGEVRRYNEDWEEEFMLDGIVTHWMPMPEPPSND